MGETKGACVSRYPLLLRAGYHICRDTAKMLFNFANYSVKIIGSRMVTAGEGITAGMASDSPLPPAGMVAIASGVYTPLFQRGGVAAPIRVEAFYLDTYAVTEAQYLAFVGANPQWHRRRVPRLLAELSYLRHWQDDSHPAGPVDTWSRRPVTAVSWFAAKAYCQWQQKRLPRLAEWEYAALASATAADGRREAAYLNDILAWYARPSEALAPLTGSGGKNYWGVYDLHGVIWEWVADFHTALVTGESRGDSDLERNLFCGAGVVGVAEQERTNYPAFLRYAYRSSLQGAYTVLNLGFRCVKDMP